MSEERAEYTVHPDVAIRLEVAERHIKQLESTNDGLTMVMGRHADTITEQAKRIERIAEEKAQAIAQLECASARIAELEATIARLRNERLLEYTVPVTLLRYIVNSHPHLPVDDRIAASRWLDTVKVTHD